MILPRSAIPAAVFVLGGLAAASPARALGLGAAPSSIPFGQPLDLSVPLRLGGAPLPPPACLQAQVSVGEHRLPPGSVHLQIEGRDPPRVRIRSDAAVQEPTVTLRLTVGCQGAVSRQFVVFADPAVPPGAVANDAPRALAPAERLARREVPVRAPALPVAGVAPSAQAAPQRVLAPTTQSAQSAPSVPSAQSAQNAQSAGAATAVAPLPSSAEQTATAAAWAAAASAARQLAQMKGDLAQARQEAAAQHASLLQLRTRLAQAEDHGRVQTALAAFVFALGLVALWLGWRVRALQHERQSGWSGTPMPRGDEALDFGDAPQPAEASAAAAAPVRTPPPLLRVAELPLSAPAEDPARSTAQRIDALIDLEQQTEFFVLLGDDDAAVELLRAHLRAHDDAGPLPYLKLLQIHRRRGAREAYERVGRRFTQRFAAPAPGWDAADDARELCDDAAIAAELQARWPQPAETLAWLEQWLLGVYGGALPSLPACRDALTLYAVAKDLLHQPRQVGAGVDLLLPLASDDEAAAMLRPSIFDTLQPRSTESARIDVDLSSPAALTDSRGARRPRRSA